jgi:hypothetical protein
MTPAKMFDGDLWVLASDAVKMAEKAYKNGQTDEREACARDFEAEADTWTAWPQAGAAKRKGAAAIRSRGQA